jgi:uncharacterized protein YbcV (DUF1398 family)
MKENILAAYSTSKSYPELVRKLMEVGIRSYTVDTATGTILYRMDNGEHVIHHGEAQRNIAPTFSESGTIEAIRSNQQGKSTYPEFMDAMATAGIYFYEATLNGENKRVTYIGKDGAYEERIPI